MLFFKKQNIAKLDFSSKVKFIFRKKSSLSINCYVTLGMATKISLSQKKLATSRRPEKKWLSQSESLILIKILKYWQIHVAELQM